MTDNHIDMAKGRAKEAAGALTGGTRRKNEGRPDQAKGSIKDVADRAADRHEPAEGDEMSKMRKQR